MIGSSFFYQHLGYENEEEFKKGVSKIFMVYIAAKAMEVKRRRELICFDVREGDRSVPVRTKISEYLSNQFKVETRTIEGSKFYEYKTFITIPSMIHLETMKDLIIEYFSDEEFKVTVEFNIRFTMSNPILTILYDRR